MPKVLHIGPCDSPGGMANVMRILAEHPPEGWQAELLASHVVGSPWAKWRAYRRARKTLIRMLNDASRRPDVVHLHTAADWSWWRKRRFALLAHSVGSSVVVHIHSGKFDTWLGASTSSRCERFRQTIEEIGATVVVLSDVWKEQFTKSIGPTIAISNPVDLNLGPDNGSRDRDHLLLLGRNDPVKNHSMAIEIATKLRLQRPNLRLSMTGVETSTKPFVEALGWVSEERKLHLLQTASLLLLPSSHEGQPMVALEANACGLPIVASDHLSSLPSSTFFAGPEIEDWVSEINTLLEHPPFVEASDPLAHLESVQQQWMACYSALLVA